MRSFSSLAMVLLLSVVCASCGNRKRHDPIPPKPDARVEQLEELYDDYLTEAEQLRDPVTGWLTPHDCDGMLWTGKYAAAHGVEGVNILAAEYPDQPGRFNRRPGPPWCWPEDSASTWSRDMSIGLFAYAYKKKQLDLLKRHAEYGLDNVWKMGEPLGDFRVVYTPAVIGNLYQIIYALGGGDNPRRRWPNIYPKGLDDYKAHLQVMDIWLRCAVGGDPEDGHGSISKAMFKRLEEHVEREPFNPFFLYVHGLFTGDMSKAITMLLDPSEPVGTYVRCGDEKRRCILAERIFTSSMVLQWIQQKELSIKE